VIDTLENFRENVRGMLEISMSSMSQRMNEVMKVLTIIATIFIPLTFIAGIYGMNFNPESSPWNMPELSWRWGYPPDNHSHGSRGVGDDSLLSKKEVAVKLKAPGNRQPQRSVDWRIE
jgi:hypothetical protein